MRNKLKILVLLVIHLSACAGAEELILTKNNLGSLKLSKESLVSFSTIKEAFPQYSVKYEIASGDSPDFHLISVSNKNNELLFYIVSYLDEGVTKNTEMYDIDLLKITSSKISDQYGIRVGDHLDKVVKIRGSDLHLSANHFDNSLGSEMIYYQFTIKPSNDLSRLGVDYMNPGDVTKEQAIKDNPKITSISWPRSSWD